jgi:hypothetical protein
MIYDRLDFEEGKDLLKELNIESKTESAREAYSDRKKELQKDVRGWFPWVYLILGMVL